MSEIPSKTILIVDDDREIVELFNEMVNALGDYRILNASSGNDALRVIENDLPDLIMMDIMMEGMDGIELCRNLKDSGRTSHIPVVAVTVIHQKEVMMFERIMASGVDDYMKKPFSMEQLKEVLDKHLHGQ